ncbi:MAG: hypothetical protein H0W71_01590 [Sphingomonas sp.]|nr:hypothetical protein [Sphingomonas sp.]
MDISEGMVGIARSAGHRQPVAAATLALMDDAAIKSPLSSEPFLVRGVEASLSGDQLTGARAFIQAQRREPRSTPAAYFLADYYLRAGKPHQGLRQATLLARLSPGGVATAAPYVAAYAQNPSNWREIRALFRSDKSIQDNVLMALARDGKNAGVILAIADRSHRSATSPWLPTLLQSLVRNGDFGRARVIWASVARVNTSPGTWLYDATFSDPAAPPPFNWQLTSSHLGIAERQPNHRLRVLYYGADDGVLASQLLLLRPGTYRLRAAVASGGIHPEKLSWLLRCNKSSNPLSSIPLDAAAQRGWTFKVPANCHAQWLELWGRSEDVPQQAEATLGGLQLKQVAEGD